MERGTFILSTGFVIMVGLYTLNMTRADIETRDNSTHYGNKRQARQIALAGVAIATNILRTEYNLGWGLQNRQVMGGTLTVSVDTTGLEVGSRQRRVTSAAEFFGERDTVTAIIQLAPPSATSFDMTLLNVQAAIEAQGRTFLMTPSYKFFVDAYDSAGGVSGARYGFGASGELTAQRVITGLGTSARDSVVGLGTNPSVTTLGSVVDRERQASELRRIATIVHRSGTLARQRSWGTMDDPEIVYVTRGLTVDRRLVGAGILCINGDLTVRDSLNWSGYVIVSGKTLTVQSSRGARIEGAMFYGDDDRDLKFGSSGSMLKIIYNRTILNTLNLKLFNIVAGKPSLVRLYD